MRAALPIMPITSMDSGLTVWRLQWPPVSSMYNVITGHLSMWPAHHLLPPRPRCQVSLSEDII